MMQLTFIMVVFVGTLAWLVLCQPPDEVVRRYRLTRVLQWIGLIFLVGFATFWGWWGLAEMVSDPSGIIHLLPAVPLALIGVALSVVFSLATPQESPFRLSNLLFTLLTIVGPFLFSGLFLLIAARVARTFSLSGKAGSASDAAHFMAGRPVQQRPRPAVWLALRLWRFCDDAQGYCWGSNAGQRQRWSTSDRCEKGNRHEQG
jgi:hypothetical protein